jgi:hypothetical protein
MGDWGVPALPNNRMSLVLLSNRIWASAHNKRSNNKGSYLQLRYEPFCGSDGGCTVTYDFSNLKLHEQQEIVDPILLPPSKKPRSRYSVSLTQIPECQWEEVAHRKASGESLRQLATMYGVSHETIRQILMRMRITG